MEALKLKLSGITPLITHNNQTANPLNRYSKFLKSVTSKRKKTDADHQLIARIEWEAGLYLDNGLAIIPARCLEATFWAAAKKTKDGKKWQSGAIIDDDFCEIKYDGVKINVKENGDIPNNALDKFYQRLSFQEIVKVSNAQIVRTRPIFENWELSCTINFDENVLDKRTVLEIAETAGHYVGLCEKRPRMGRFEIEELN